MSLTHETNEILGEGLYMKYERFIHRTESKIGTMIGTDVAMYAIRRNLYCPVPENAILDDFIIALKVVANGYRVVYNDHAIGREDAAGSVEKEFIRKVRIFAGGFQSIPFLMKKPSPFRFPVVAFQFMFHKLFRWLSPVFMIGLFVSNLFLLHNSLYLSLFALQCMMYAIAMIGYLNSSLRNNSLIYFPMYFCAINLAALLGLINYYTGRQGVRWECARK